MVVLLSTVMACSAPGARIEKPAATTIEPVPPPPERTAGPDDAGPAIEPLPQPPDVEAEEAVTPREVSEQDLLRFTQGFMALSRDAQRKVLTQAETLYGQDHRPQNLLRYALLVTVAGSDRPAAVNRVRGDLRAFLEPKAAAQDELAPLANLLLRVLDDREQLTAQFVAQTDMLQKKLDELKAIEQQLLERSEPADKTTTP